MVVRAHAASWRRRARPAAAWRRAWPRSRKRWIARLSWFGRVSTAASNAGSVPTTSTSRTAGRRVPLRDRGGQQRVRRRRPPRPAGRPRRAARGPRRTPATGRRRGSARRRRRAAPDCCRRGSITRRSGAEPLERELRLERLRASAAGTAATSDWSPSEVTCSPLAGAGRPTTTASSRSSRTDWMSWCVAPVWSDDLDVAAPRRRASGARAGRWREARPARSRYGASNRAEACASRAARCAISAWCRTPTGLDEQGRAGRR